MLKKKKTWMLSTLNKLTRKLPDLQYTVAWAPPLIVNSQPLEK